MRATSWLLAVLIVGAVGAPGSSAAARAAPCHPRGTRGLRSDAQARVYRRGVDVYGCAFANGKPRLIGGTYSPQESSSGGGGITHLRLAGHYVAVVSVFEDEFGRLAGITVYNLRTRRIAFEWEVGANHPDVSDDADVTDLVLRPNGSVAFIEGVGGPGSFLPPKRLIVRRNDPRGNVILEDSATIAPTSLRLTGHEITWTSAGATRSDTLL
jgi:hypothetical protein